MEEVVPSAPSILAFPLVREFSQTMAQSSSDRALLFLLEQAVNRVKARGALLMTPHEKLREMVPLVGFPLGEKDRDPWKDGFLRASYQAYLEERAVTQTEEDHAHLFLPPDFDCGSSLFLPVHLAGKAVGLLFIYRCRTCGVFSPEHQDFLTTVMPFLGTLIENFRLQNEMIHKNSRLSALYEISQRAESMIDLRDIYDAMGKVVLSYIDGDAYLLYLLNPDGKTLEIRGNPPSGLFPGRVLLGEGPVGLAALERRPHLTFTETFKSVLILPMIVSGKLVGVVTIGSRKSYAYRDEDIIGLRIITTQIASIDQLFRDLLRLRGFTQSILECMSSGVLIFDNNAVVNFCNRAMATILSHPLPDGWSPYNPSDLVSPDLRSLLVEVLESRMTLENKKIRFDELVPPGIFEVNAFPFRDEQGMMLGTAFFFKDITQISRLEEQLKRADRLSALGVLAAGIAHEIRNPLTGMKMIVQLLASEFTEGDSRREPLGIIQNEIGRLERIIVNLLDFARPGKPQAEPLSIVSVLNACLMLVQTQINKQGVRLERVFPEELPTLIGDADQLKQVFLNILTNAIQAMRPGGTLTVSIEPREGGVIVGIKDTGIGIPQERLRAIFDPFMTTKEDGTGLGLSMALRIVEEHGGRIDVDSTEGVGSTFAVILPDRHEKAPGQG